MFRQCHITVVIPALDEQASIGTVIQEIPNYVDQIIVVDNNSQDATRAIAETAGARVIGESHKGYGRACLTGIEAAGETDIIAFINGGYSDYPADLNSLIEPVAAGECDLAIGCRRDVCGVPKGRFRHQHWGTKLACWTIWLLYRYRVEDMGPLRCISLSALKHLRMQDEDFGWTAEMQLKSLQSGQVIMQVPVRYRKRIGRSKISGTVTGTIKAALKIFYWIFRLAVQPYSPRYF